jgi:hypothetical protein
LLAGEERETAFLPRGELSLPAEGATTLYREQP